MFVSYLILQLKYGDQMKESTIKVLTDEDTKLVNKMMQLGMSRKSAYMFVFLVISKTGISRDIEITTGLRQPEVSVAAQELAPWLKKENMPSEKRRGAIIYSLSVFPETVIKAVYDKLRDARSQQDEAYTQAVAQCQSSN